MTEITIDEATYNAIGEWPIDEPPLIQRLRLEPGDTLVIVYDRPVPEMGKVRIGELIHRRLPDNKVLILDGGPRLAVLGPGE